MATTITRDTNNNFVFCSKFEKLLNDENRAPIVAAFQKFCKMAPDYALTTLWRLTYDEVIASEIITDLGLNLEMISSETGKLRDELRKQFKKLNPDFLVPNVSEACKASFEALAKKTDPIVAAVVHDHCSYRLYEIDVERALFLLHSDKENNFFGGIRELAFDKEEAAYLKPFHMQIHDLLEAMFEEKNLFDGTFANQPFKGLDTRLEEAGIELPFEMGDPEETQHDVTVTEEANEPVDIPGVSQEIQPESGYKQLTSEAIVAHKDAFAAFVEDNDLNLLVQLGTLGFDLNEVMAKKDKIVAFLKAIASKEKADEKVFSAIKAREKAEAKLLKASEALMKK